MITNSKLIGSNIEPEAYHRTDKKRGDVDYPMGRSSLMLFAECPHKWIRGYKPKQTESTEWGSMLDCAVLTPIGFDQHYITRPLTYPATKTGEPKPWNWNATFCDEWAPKDRDGIRRHDGKLVMSAEDNGAIADAMDALKESGSYELLCASVKQVMYVAEWHDKATGLVIPLKTLIDLVPALNNQLYGHCLADFKTSFTASGDRWSKVAAEHNYHVQAALSLDIYENATGEGRDSWLNIVQENFAPWEVADPIPMLSQEFITEGRKAYHAALREYCQCLKYGEWPSYPTSNLVIAPFQVIDPPQWLAMQQMHRMPEVKPKPEFASELPS